MRRGYQALNRGDIDAFLAVLHPEHELRPSGIVPGLKPVYHGRRGFREFWRDWGEQWESITADVDELRAAGDRVVGLVTNRARGRDGVEVRRQGAHVITLRDGLVLRTTVYASWAEALQAAGLDVRKLAPPHG